MVDKIKDWLRERVNILIFVLIITLVFLFSQELGLFFIPFLTISILHFIAGSVLLLIVVSICLHYIIKDELHSNKKLQIKRLHSERHIHNHYSYSNIAIIIATICGFLFTAYSDVFYQQGDFISPIENGLKNNKTTFKLDNLYACDDTTNLVFVIDVSGSINSSKTKVDNKWINIAKDSITNYNWEFSSKIQDLINKINKKIPADLVKLKICYLLVSQRDSLIKHNRNYVVSLFSFGKNTDVNNKGFNLKDNYTFENLISTILDLKYSKNQSSETDNEKVIRKIKLFIKPHGFKDAFGRPKTVISIFSDFINESKSQDTNRLSNIITEISSKSTFFNLFYFESNDSSKFVHKFKVLPIFNKALYPDQINLQNIKNEIDLRCANFKSPYSIEFIINKPFHIYSSQTCLVIPDAIGKVKCKLISQGIEDEWQQFRVNDNPINYVTPFTVKNNDYLYFSGHVPDQFSKTEAEFEFINSKEKVTCEIIFKKGLPNFIARLFFSSGLLIFLISIAYFLFLLNQFILFKNLFKLLKRKKELVSHIQNYELRSNDVEGGYFIPCQLDNISVDASLDGKNTISLSFTRHLLSHGKLKDKTGIEEHPFDEKEDTIPIGCQKKFNVKLFNHSLDEVLFEVVENGVAISISKELLTSLGFDDDISDGKLKLKK